MHSSNPFHTGPSSQHPQTDPPPWSLGPERFRHPQLRSWEHVPSVGTCQPSTSTAMALPLTGADAEGTWSKPENGNGMKASALSQR